MIVRGFQTHALTRVLHVWAKNISRSARSGSGLACSGPIKFLCHLSLSGGRLGGHGGSLLRLARSLTIGVVCGSWGCFTFRSLMVYVSYPGDLLAGASASNLPNLH